MKSYGSYSKITFHPFIIINSCLCIERVIEIERESLYGKLNFMRQEILSFYLITVSLEHGIFTYLLNNC